MACKLPTIVSVENEASDTITYGVHSLILAHPNGAIAPATMIRRRCQDQAFSGRLGKKPASTTLSYTWERNGRKPSAIFEQILRRKLGFEVRTLTQEL